MQFAKVWVHSGMVTINSQKMSKSLGNIVTIEQALKRWGMNSLRLYCLSVHYAKPLDYTEELLRESVQRWRQIETCAYELRFAADGGTDGDDDSSNSSSNSEDMCKVCDKSMQAFEDAMSEDMNISLALTEFMKLVTKINQYASADKLTRKISDIVLPYFNKIMSILGLAIVEVSNRERTEIEASVAHRNKLRAEKKFQKADEIRKKLIDNSIELMDHKARTVWIKREKTA
jgi:cysteinyl-tRNA synthetase